MPQSPNQYLTGYSGVDSDSLAQFLRRTFTDQEEEQAESIIAQIEAEIASRCNRQFAFQTGGQYPEPIVYEEYFNLPRAMFFPSAFPIATIVSVEVNGEEQENLVDSVDYFVYDSYIEFYPKLFSYGYGAKALKLQYTISKFWGYDLELLVKRLAGKIWLSAENAGESVKETSFASTRDVMDSQEFKREVELVISRYKKRLT